MLREIRRGKIDEIEKPTMGKNFKLNTFVLNSTFRRDIAPPLWGKMAEYVPRLHTSFGSLWLKSGDIFRGRYSLVVSKLHPKSGKSTEAVLI